MMNEIYEYWITELAMETLQPLHQFLTYELANIDINALHLLQVRHKKRRGGFRKQPVLTIPLPIVYQRDRPGLTYAFCDYFLLKYAVHMTIGDLILSTNIAYIADFQNMIPYSRLNRLSTLSMLLHIYDGTSYGLNKDYGPLKGATSEGTLPPLNQGGLRPPSDPLSSDGGVRGGKASPEIDLRRELI
jgi:hypothetical protein